MTINPLSPATHTNAASAVKPAAAEQPATYERPTTGFWELFGNPGMTANLPSQISAPTPDPQYPNRPLLGFQALFWNPDFAQATPATPTTAPATPFPTPVSTPATPSAAKQTDLMSDLPQRQNLAISIQRRAADELFDQHFHTKPRSKA